MRHPFVDSQLEIFNCEPTSVNGYLNYMSKQDIRDKAYLNHKDILGLNFIRSLGIYYFRRYYREGLRSHIMEVLRPEDVEKETKGIIRNGIRLYPRAEPLKMLRIFRTKFVSLKEAEEELRRVKIITTYLSPYYLAKPEEFLVSYIGRGKCELLLCGLQEYVKGEIIEPWGRLDDDHLISLLCDMGIEDSIIINSQWTQKVRKNAENFIAKIKQMIMETNHVPDLAGVGNLLFTKSGDIKLVDINNISSVSFDHTIKLDDRGYPVCDKSIEALFLLERKLSGGASLIDTPLSKTFLDPERMKDVKAIEKDFHESMEGSMYYWPSYNVG